MEKTSHWHTGYGLLLKTAGHTDDAIIQFQKAADLDPKSWKAFEGLSKCYAALDEYDKGTTFLNNALEVVPENFKPAVQKIRANLIDVMLQKGDFEASLQYSKAAFEEDPGNDQYVEVYVQSLYALNDFKQMVETVRTIQAQGRFISCFSGILDEVFRAFRSEGCIGMVISELNIVLYKGSPLNPYMAVFIFEYDESEDKAIDMFEAALDPDLSDTVLPQYSAMHKGGIFIARSQLSYVYYERAVTERLEGRDPTEWENKLKDLALIRGEAETSKAEYRYTISLAAIKYGLYLWKHCKADKETWMPWFRNSLLLALDMLCDDDPINDMDAYRRCVINLIGCGDLPNALAAAAVIFSPQYMTDNSWLSAARKLNFYKHPYICDGICTTFNRAYNLEYQRLVFCVECVGVALCNECHEKLLASKLPMRVCNPKHEFVQFYPVPEEAKGVAAKFDGEKMVVQQEWLDGLRKTWA
jgi:tetratricopeptide (TPR) repeat protein